MDQNNTPNQVKTKKPFHGWLIFVIILAVLVVVGLGAYVWATGGMKSDASQSSSSTTESSSSTSVVEVEPEPEKIKLSSIMMPESPARDESYFDNAVFIGDSFTEGIQAYGYLENTTVLAETGLNTDGILTREVIETSSGNTTVLGALQDLDVDKIYILLGANGIAWINTEQYIARYSEFLAEVIALKPDAQIFVQSLFPVTENFANMDNNIDNEKINEYNAALFEMTQLYDVYFVNTHEAMLGDGSSDDQPADAMPEEYASGDGMHINANSYQRWIDYLLTHTVPDHAEEEYILSRGIIPDEPEVDNTSEESESSASQQESSSSTPQENSESSEEPEDNSSQSSESSSSQQDSPNSQDSSSSESSGYRNIDQTIQHV